MSSQTYEAPSPTFPIPADVKDVLANYYITEYAYITPRGEPLCWPVTPYWYPERQVPAIATGVGYPNKAYYAKTNPKIAMFMSDSTQSGIKHAPVLVQGLATVLDQDVQENTDRYIRDIRAKLAIARVAFNPVSVRMMSFYLPRIWVEMTPIRVVMHSSPLRTVGTPLEPWSAQPAIGASSGSKGEHKPLSQREVNALRQVIAECPPPVVTVVGPDGFPWCERRVVVELNNEGSIRLAETEVSLPPGPAALTFHRIELFGTRLHAYLIRGRLDRQQTLEFQPSKLVNFFGNGTVFPFSAIPRVPQLRRSLKKELARLGQPMPKLRIPK